MTLAERRRGLMAAQGGGGSTVHGTWDDLFRTIDSGTHATEYELGEILYTTIGEYSIKMQIVAFDADAISGTNNTAAVSLISYTHIPGNRRFNPAYVANTSGTGTLGGWDACELRASLNGSTFLNSIQNDVLARIVTVDKYSDGYDISETLVKNQKTEDRIWIPSYREMGSSICETVGVTYGSFFTSDSIRMRQNYSETTGTAYRCRSAYSTSNLWTVALGGGLSTTNKAANWATIVVGFCVN